MTNRNRIACLFAAACAMALLAACAKPVDDTRDNVAAPADPATTAAAPATTAPAARADEPVANFVAHGNEPFWSVAIDGDTLTWKTPEMPEGRQLVAKRATRATGAGFTGKDGDKDFSLDITAGACSDGMSDETFGYVARWDYGGKMMTGCAKRSD